MKEIFPGNVVINANLWDCHRVCEPMCPCDQETEFSTWSYQDARTTIDDIKAYL